MSEATSSSGNEKRSKKYLIYAGICIVALFAIVYFGEEWLGGSAGSLKATEEFYDAFDEFDSNNFVSINSVTGKATDGAPTVQDGKLLLPANDNLKAPVVLSRPLKVKDKIVVRRKSIISSSNGYAGYLKLVWVKKSADEDAYVLLSVEYNDYGEMAGEKGHFSLLSKAQSQVEATYDFILGEEFSEEIIYDVSSSTITYSLNGNAAASYEVPSLSGGYIFIIMQTATGAESGEFWVDELYAKSSEVK